MQGTLSDIVTFCQPPDILNFLFTREPIHLSYLASSNLEEVALSGKGSFLHVTTSDAVPDPTLSFSRALFAFVPAFSMHNLTLGFGIIESAYTAEGAFTRGHQDMFRSEYRFVKDNNRNMFFTVLEDPAHQYIHIHYCKLLSPTSQQRNLVSFHRDSFLSAIRRGAFNLSEISKTVYELQTGREFRRCPTCNSVSSICQCRLIYVRPTHPFDREAFKTNVAWYLGTFTGVLRHYLFLPGQQTQKKNTGIKHILEGTADVGSIQRLRNWALQKHTGNEDPLHSRMSTPLNGVTVTNAAEIRPQQNSNPPAIASGVDLQMMEAMLPLNLLNRADTNAENNNFNYEGVEYQQSLQTGAENVAVSSGLDQGREHDVAIGVSEFEDVKDDSDDSDDMLERLRAEHRREQNRRSARKSNMKKKMLNEALKRDLQVERNKADRLRKHELSLRRENLRLRKILENG